MPNNFRQSERVGADVLVDILRNPQSIYGLWQLFAINTLCWSVENGCHQDLSNTCSSRRIEVRLACGVMRSRLYCFHRTPGRSRT